MQFLGGLGVLIMLVSIPVWWAKRWLFANKKATPFSFVGNLLHIVWRMILDLDRSLHKASWQLTKRLLQNEHPQWGMRILGWFAALMPGAVAGILLLVLYLAPVGKK